MSADLLYIIVLICGGFLLSRITLQLFQTNGVISDYRFFKDPWLYLFFVITAGVFSIYFSLRTDADFILPFNLMWFALIFLCSFLIFMAFLFEMEWLTFGITAVCSALVIYFLPADFSLFDNLLPFWADRLAMLGILMLITYGSRLLNGLDGVLAMQFIVISAGMVTAGLLGGLPILISFIGAYLVGVWLGYLHLDWYPSALHLHDGAAMGAGFIMGGIMLECSMEYAGSVMLVLNMYMWVEIAWTLIRRFIFDRGNPDWYENTGYWAVFQTGIEVPIVDWGIFRILLINFLLGMFQLYSSTAFSIAIFAAMFDLWYLNIMYTAKNGRVTFKEANQEFVKNIKKGFAEFKEVIERDKKAK